MTSSTTRLVNLSVNQRHCGEVNFLDNLCGEMNAAKVHRSLEDMVRMAGSQKRAAAQLGISRQYLNLMLRGRKNPAVPAVLSKLGLTKKITYAR